MYRILIAVCTFNRDEMLAECLKRICQMPVPDDVTRELLVVYNGTEGFEKTESLVKRITEEHGVPGIALIEPQKGIPFARNKALIYANAFGGNSHLAFLDDDDYPDENWLTEITRTLKANHGFAAAGPQRPIFPEDTPDTQRECLMHGERKMKNGALTAWAATNNVVFSVEHAVSNGIQFAESFAKTGGSDKLFFQELCRATGFRVMWSGNAVVYQPIPKSRLNNKWVLARAYRTGTTEYPTEARTRGPRRAIPYCLSKAAYKVLNATKEIVIGTLKGRKGSLLNASCRFVQGIGCAAGILPFLRTRKYI